MSKLIGLFVVFFSHFAYADIVPKSVAFVYMTTDGTTWVDCTSRRVDANDWVATCGSGEFDVRLLLKAGATAFEINFWASEVKPVAETHTQSTWITLTDPSQMKAITAYLGFTNDTRQLRAVIGL